MSKLLGPGQAALVLSSIVPDVAAETSWTSCGNYGVALNAVAVGWAASRVCSGTIWKRDCESCPAFAPMSPEGDET
jgi:hypothetical protein